MEEDRLRELSLFGKLNKPQRKRLAPLVEEIEVEPGELLAREGTLAYEMFVILEGTAAVSQGDMQIGVLGAGSFFGEIALHDDSRRRTSTVVATSRMRLAVMQGHDVRMIERELPSVAAQIRQAIDARLAGDRMR